VLDKRKTELWNALNLGPQWVERGELLSLAEQAEEPEAAPALTEAPKPAPENRAPVRSEAVQKDAPQATLRTASAHSVPREMPHRTPPQPVRKAAAEPQNTAHGMNDRSVSAEGFSSERQEKILHADWTELKQLVHDCKVCAISRQRIQPVFGEGEPKRRLMLIGEAPGREEDSQGKPFVGPSGKLLDHILEACGLDRQKDLGIFNMLKCRPPMNATPEKSEKIACQPFLDRQIELIDPDLIVAMGKPAASRFFGEAKALNPLRGKVHEFNVGGRNRKVIVTFHPSYLLRSPGEKRKAWLDWCLILDTLEGLTSNVERNSL